MQLITPVILPKTDITLDTDSRVMMIGSCFAEHVGEKLVQYMGDDKVNVNPFGVLYNPVSIAQGLELLIDETFSQHLTPNTQHIFLGQDGLWHSWLFTSHFSGSTREECEIKTKDAIENAREFLKHATLLCITFGTTRCYRLKNENQNKETFVVANCHKEPQRCFTEIEPTLDELQVLWGTVLQKLKAYNPTLRICFTVSPYRYKKYGFHESQIQKAKLLLLVDKLGEAYFPSYEIMMDELRDYRFYANDMLHPSDLAVDIIAERFMDWTFTPAMKAQAALNLKEFKRSQHRKINGER